MELIGLEATLEIHEMLKKNCELEFFVISEYPFFSLHEHPIVKSS